MIDIEHPEKYQMRDGKNVVGIFPLATPNDQRLHVIYEKAGRCGWVNVNPLGYYGAKESPFDVIPKQEWEYRKVGITAIYDRMQEAKEDNVFIANIERRPRNSTDESEWERVDG